MTNAKHIAEDVTARVEAVLADWPRPIPLHEPRFDLTDEQRVQNAVRTGWVSSAGADVREFEEAIARYCGVSHAVATCSGTAALHTGLLVSGVAGNDEVILPSVTFVATANAVCHAGAVPHLVDAEDDTFGINPQALDDHLSRVCVVRDGRPTNKLTGRRIAGIIVVHIFGHGANIKSLQAIAEKYDLPLWEDSTEALGSTRWERHCGTFGAWGTLSFNGNKIITTGGGGMLLTDDARLAEHARQLTTTAKAQHRWEFMHDQVAYNYRLPNLNAALGCSQMARFDRILTLKRQLHESYTKAFADADYAQITKEPADGNSNHWLNALMLNVADLEIRDAVLSTLYAHQIMARPLWQPMHRLPMFQSCPQAESLSVSDSLYARCITLPSSVPPAG